MTHREVEWDDEQRTNMQALALVHKGECSCGHPLDESTDPDNEGRYKVPPPTRCHACTAIYDAMAEVRSAGNPHPQALRWRSHLPLT